MNEMWMVNDALQAVWGPGFNIRNLQLAKSPIMSFKRQKSLSFV